MVLRSSSHLLNRSLPYFNSPMTRIASSSDAAPDIFSTEQKARILGHMNDDHADAVLRYARHFAQRTGATAARLVDIDHQGISLLVTEPSGETPVRVEFERALEKAEDAHHTLVAMARAARVALGEPSLEMRREAALIRAREIAAKFRSDFKTVILGTTAFNGEPDASVAPAILDSAGAFLVYVSTLSSHTRNLVDTKRASVLLIEDENSAHHLLARKRLTCRCAASLIDRGSDGFVAAMAEFKTKFGTVMDHLERMQDFQLIRLAPWQGRLVTGFGQAYEVDPVEWTNLTHLGGVGHGHATEQKEAS